MDAIPELSDLHAADQRPVPPAASGASNLLDNLGKTTEQPSAGGHVQADQEAEAGKPRSKWGVYRPHELKDRCARDGRKPYLIEGLISERALGLLVGDSGLGKSPLAYQMALSVAAGAPFLGAAVQQRPVLYLDFENGLGEVDELVTRLSEHLGLGKPPEDLALWNLNDSPSNWGQHGHTFPDLVRAVQPGLVFIDPVSALYPDIEKTNSDAAERYQEFRRVIRDTPCSIVCVHHLRKKPENVPTPSLEGNLREFFQRVRGASVLVTGADVRLGVDVPAKTGSTDSDIALVIRGYGRVRGEIPAWHLARVLDQDGDPLGYRKVAAIALLCNPDQQAAFPRLPERFPFKDAKREYGKGDQATKNFLDKAIAVGILRKAARGVYEKVKPAE